MTHLLFTQASKRRVFYIEPARTFPPQRAKKGKDDLQTNSLISVPENIGKPLNSKVQFQNILLGSVLCGVCMNKEKSLMLLKTGIRACLTKPTSVLAGMSFLVLLMKR